MDAASEIAAADAIPEDGSLLFSVENGEDRIEGIVLALADGVVAFENYCQHWRDVRLDTGDGATMRNGEIVCEKHGAYFEGDSGYCNFGPCEGAVLQEIEVAVEDGTVHLVDEEYSAPTLGPVEDGENSSGNRIGFSGN